MNIVYYKAISAESVDALSDLVCEALDLGMQPLGPMSVAVATDAIDQQVYFRYAQAMVEYEEEKETKPCDQTT